MPAILLTNARSVLRKLDELFGLVNGSKMRHLSQVICVTETWLQPHISTTQTELAGYTQFRKDRDLTSSGKECGGGILLYVDEKWATNWKVINSYCDHSLEMLTVKINPHWKPRGLNGFAVISCYAPFTGESSKQSISKSTIETIVRQINEVERQLPGYAVIIMGDFNGLPIKLPEYQQVVTKATRHSKILDKCFTNVRHAYQCEQYSPLQGDAPNPSDHNIIHLLPSYVPKSQLKPDMVNKRSFTPSNIETLQSCLDYTDWDVMINKHQSIEQNVDIFTEYVKFCTDQCIPEVMVKRYANNKPYITKEIASLISSKHEAFQNGDLKTYNKLRHKIRRDIIKSKKLYNKRIQERMVDEPKRAWSDIKCLAGMQSRKTSQKPCDIPPDELNQFYARFEKPRNPPNNTPTQHATSSFEPITTHQVRLQMKRIDTCKGPGPDNIYPAVLRNCADQLAEIVTTLFNNVIDEGTTPAIWRTSVIKPLPKVSNPKVSKDYRPIAITCHLCKLLEKLVKNYITSNTVLDQYQFAYQPRRSTQDALFCLLTSISKFIDIKRTNQVRALFLDFSSAFNTIDVSKLIPRLSHLDSRIVKWISSLLTDRIQYTKTGHNTVSSKIITNTGTPQGTVLSPVLFTIYTDVLRAGSSKSTVIKFADDTVLLGYISDPGIDNEVYFDEVNRISSVCSDNDLLLNPTKTHELIFTTQRETPEVPTLMLGDVAIPQSNNVKYLGVLVDNKLKFHDHMIDRLNTASKRMYVVRRFSALGAESRLVTTLFRSFIESILFYCITIFYSHIYSNDKKAIKSFFKEAKFYGAELDCDIDARISELGRTYSLRIFHDDNHFIHNLLERMPSGRLRTHRVRASIGKECFYGLFIKNVNKAIF